LLIVASIWLVWKHTSPIHPSIHGIHRNTQVVFISLIPIPLFRVHTLSSFSHSMTFHNNFLEFPWLSRFSMTCTNPVIVWLYFPTSQIEMASLQQYDSEYLKSLILVARKYGNGIWFVDVVKQCPCIDWLANPNSKIETERSMRGERFQSSWQGRI